MDKHTEQEYDRLYGLIKAGKQEISVLTQKLNKSHDRLNTISRIVESMGYEKMPDVLKIYFNDLKFIVACMKKASLYTKDDNYQCPKCGPVIPCNATYDEKCCICGDDLA